MRVAIISDVHGNLPALEAVIEDIRARGADLIVNLGDCVTSPLWPREAALHGGEVVTEPDAAHAEG